MAKERYPLRVGPMVSHHLQHQYGFPSLKEIYPVRHTCFYFDKTAVGFTFGLECS